MPHRARASLPPSLLLACVLAVAGAADLAAQTLLGPPVLVSPEPFCSPLAPDVAPLPGGGAAVVWEEDDAVGRLLRARLLDAEGRPTGEPLAVAAGLGLGEPQVAATDDHLAVAFFVATSNQSEVQVYDRQGLSFVRGFPLGAAATRPRSLEAAPDGSLLLVNASDTAIDLVRFQPDGTILGQESLFQVGGARRFSDVTGAPAEGGAYLAFREVPSGGAPGGLPLVLTRLRLDGVADPSAPPTREIPGARDVELATLPDGRLVAVWEDAQGVVFELMDENLVLATRLRLATFPGGGSSPRLAVSPAGEIAVSWTRLLAPPGGIPNGGPIIQTFLQLVDPELGPRAPLAAIPQGGDPETEADGAPWLVYTRSTRLSAVWERVFPFTADPPMACSNGLGVFAVSFATRCTPDPRTLCLQDDRFAVQVAWEDPRSGDTGAGTARPVTGDTGTFWFFDDDNLELMVKVLDGRLINGHWWVFYGSLTDVEFVMTVRDVVTGEERTFTNPPSTMASEGNTTAFAEEP